MKKYTDTFFRCDDEPASPKSQSDSGQKEPTDTLPIDALSDSAKPPTPPKKPQQNQSPNSSASNSPETDHPLFALDEELTLAKISAKKSLAESAPKQILSRPIKPARNGVNGSSLPRGLPTEASPSQKINRGPARSATSAPLDFGVSSPWDHQKVARANGSLKLSQLHGQATEIDHDKDEDDSSSPSP